MSDTHVPTVAKPAFNWIGALGVLFTVASMSVACITYLNRVDAKADNALQQISEVKAAQRQQFMDGRDDLKQLNSKVDQLLLLTARLQNTENSRKY